MSDEKKVPKVEDKKAPAKSETRGRKKHVDVKVLLGTIHARDKNYEIGQIAPLKEEDVALLVDQGLVARIS